MPIREYKCIQCGNIDEELFTTTHDEDMFFCSKCGGITHRLMSSCSSNFHSWSDTVNKLGQAAMTPMPHLPRAE